MTEEGKREAKMEWIPLDEPAEVVLERAGLVGEMSLTMKQYSDKLEEIRIQVVENWCLCEYCRMFDPSNLNFKHWASELRAYVERLQRVTLKRKMDKRKTLTRTWIDMYDLGDPEMIFSIIGEKFDIEGFVDSDRKWAVANEFAKRGVHGLIECIASVDAKSNDYLKSEFFS